MNIKNTSEHEEREVRRPFLNEMRARNVLRMVDLLTITMFWSLSHQLRLGWFSFSIFLSNRFILVIMALMFSAYVLETADFNIRRKPLYSMFIFWGACALATSLISGVFYISALAWTSGGQDLLGRGVVIPALFGTAIVGGLFRYSIFTRMASQLKVGYWLVIGTEKIITKNKFIDLLKKDISSRGIHIWEISKNIYFKSESDVLEDNKNIDFSLDILSKEWLGIILLDDFSLSGEKLEALMYARLKGTPIYTVPEFYEEFWQKVPVLYLDHRWFAITGGFGLLHEPLHRKAKRLSDIFLSIIILILSLPIIIISSLWIKIFGGFGSFIYTQVRIGQGERKFIIYKLRTMRHDSEKDGAKWAQKNDNRIIPLGGLIRKFRIDELPQLINILRGDMSFIGPRPERPEMIVNLEREIPYFSLRHLVKPGLTGWAQVCFPYGASVDDTRHKLEYDLYYIKHQTIWLDIVIIIRTIRVVIKGFGGR